MGGEGGQAEVLVKELAAHKEMVSELRTQLHEKEEEFQVRNCVCVLKFSLCTRGMFICEHHKQQFVSCH